MSGLQGQTSEGSAEGDAGSDDGAVAPARAAGLARAVLTVVLTVVVGGAAIYAWPEPRDDVQLAAAGPVGGAPAAGRPSEGGPAPTGGAGPADAARAALGDGDGSEAGGDLVTPGTAARPISEILVGSAGAAERPFGGIESSARQSATARQSSPERRGDEPRTPGVPEWSITPELVPPSTTTTVRPGGPTPTTAQPGPGPTTTAPPRPGTTVRPVITSPPTTARPTTTRPPATTVPPTTTTTRPLPPAGCARVLARPIVAEESFFVFDGQSNSLMPSSTENYPARIMRELFPGRPYRNAAQGGSTYAQRIAWAPQNVDQYADDAPRAVLFNEGGATDVAKNIKAREVFDDLVRYVRGRRAAGFDVVIQATIPPGAFYSPPQEVQRRAYNDLLRRSCTHAGIDLLVDIDAIPQLQDHTDRRYYSDGNHVTAAATRLMVDAYAEALAR